MIQFDSFAGLFRNQVEDLDDYIVAGLWWYIGVDVWGMEVQQSAFGTLEAGAPGDEIFKCPVQGWAKYTQP